MIGTIPVVQWVTASPLWSAAASDAATMQRPSILRFASDTFMPDLVGMLERRPADLADVVAEPRSYRPQPPGAPAGWLPSLPDLKLYQAAHGHFNLVAASLVCRLPGMPDRTLDTASEEVVGFVLRRLVPSEGDSPIESAWVDDPNAGRGWRPVAGQERRVASSEELLPLFALNYATDRARRLFVGLIPTSSGDTFKGAGALSPFVSEDPVGTPIDPRMDDFDTRVLTALGALRDAEPPSTGTAAEKANIVAAALDLRREASRFLLLDFAELLASHMPAAWAAVQNPTAPAAAGAVRDLYQFLVTFKAGSAGAISLRAALLQAWEQRLRIVDEADPRPTLTVDLRDSTFSLDTLRDRLQAALPAAASGAGAAADGGTDGGADARQTVGGADEIPKLHPSPGAQFVLRCVFRRPQCTPPIDLVSEPSERFTIASFFDVDAPARTIRVQLPVRTSIADLRKYPKNVGFVLSDQLREQMARATDLKKIMQSELAAGEGVDVGLLCSFSIPIITICALMVLMIFINLLNIVFWWMPFLRICLPIALSGKRT